MTEATPKRILQRMDVKELNIAHIKSHLQVTLKFFFFFFKLLRLRPNRPRKIRASKILFILKRIDLNFNSEIVICNLI